MFLTPGVQSSIFNLDLSKPISGHYQTAAGNPASIHFLLLRLLLLLLLRPRLLLWCWSRLRRRPLLLPCVELLLRLLFLLWTSLLHRRRLLYQRVRLLRSRSARILIAIFSTGILRRALLFIYGMLTGRLRRIAVAWRRERTEPSRLL